MIVTEKQHILVDFTQLAPIPTIWHEITDRTQHGVLVSHDSGFKYLDVIGLTVDNGKDRIETEIKHWQQDRNIWTERDFRFMQTDPNTNTKYVESQNFNIWTTRSKIVKVVNMQVAQGVFKNVPHFVPDNSEEFDNSWNYEEYQDIQVNEVGEIIKDENDEPILITKLRRTTLKSGYHRAYDFFNYLPQDFSKIDLQIAQIMDRYPAVGQGYTV